MKTKQSVFVVINTKDDMTLLLLREDGKYELPGGKVEAKEPFNIAAIRETLEETGIDLSKEVLIDCGTFKHGNNGVKCTVKVYSVVLDDVTAVKLSEEHQDWLLMPTELLEPMSVKMTNKAFKSIISSETTLSNLKTLIP